MSEYEDVAPGKADNKGSEIDIDLLSAHGELTGASKAVDLENVNQRQEDVVLKDGRVAAVNYPDGRARYFEYNSDGLLTKVIQPSGETWTRAGKTQPERWESASGNQFLGTVEVSANGEYKTTDLAGLTRSYKPDGTKYLGDFPVAAIKTTLSDSRGVAANFANNLSRMDLNKDGAVNQMELSTAAASQEFDVTTRLIVTSLKAAYQPLSRLHNDPDGLEGISAKDIAKLDYLSRYEKPAWWNPTSPGLGPTVGRWTLTGGAVLVGGTVTGFSWLGGVPGLSKGGAGSWRGGIALGLGIMGGSIALNYFAGQKADQHERDAKSQDQIKRMIDGIH